MQYTTEATPRLTKLAKQTPPVFWNFATELPINTGKTLNSTKLSKRFIASRKLRGSTGIFTKISKFNWKTAKFGSKATFYIWDFESIFEKSTIRRSRRWEEAQSWRKIKDSLTRMPNYKKSTCGLTISNEIVAKLCSGGQKNVDSMKIQKIIPLFSWVWGTKKTILKNFGFLRFLLHQPSVFKWPGCVISKVIPESKHHLTKHRKHCNFCWIKQWYTTNFQESKWHENCKEMSCQTHFFALKATQQNFKAKEQQLHKDPENYYFSLTLNHQKTSIKNKFGTAHVIEL